MLGLARVHTPGRGCICHAVHVDTGSREDSTSNEAARAPALIQSEPTLECMAALPCQFHIATQYIGS
jgi:hypothetical protein